MKKVFLLLLGAVMTVSAVHAQIVEQDEAAVVYYSPKTAIRLDFTYTVETYEKGLYAQYAESMLGISDVIKENKTTYTLNDVRIGSSTSVDYDRAHKVVAGCIPMLLTINEKGLLVGYNIVPSDKPAPKHGPQHPMAPKEPKAAELTPLPEEVLIANTPLTQAQAAAKQIFHLRETRMYLLNGEVEHAPADGKAMELVLAELDKQEQALIALFTGKKTRCQKHKHFTIQPDQEEVLFYFSEENGFTDSENVDAETIRVSLHATRQQLTAPQETKKKKAPELTQLVYNLPGNCAVEVNYQGRSLAQRTIAIAQFGVDVPLSKDLFTGATLPVIQFSDKTGNIISISK